MMAKGAHGWEMEKHPPPNPQFGETLDFPYIPRDLLRLLQLSAALATASSGHI